MKFFKKEENMGNYQYPNNARQAVRALLGQIGGGARALLVTGAPGTGKTALAEAIAADHKAVFLYALLHSWSGADDLFAGISVPAAVAGDAANVTQPGVLALSAEASQNNQLVVVCLDELDKAPESVEALLLDWLQSGRVPIKPGYHLQTRLERVLVIVTSNGQRPHTEALIRRCRRLRMEPLPQALRVELAATRSGAPKGVVTLIDRACQEIAQAEGNNALSLQEIANACREIWAVCKSAQEVGEALAAWAARSDETVQVINTSQLRKLCGSIWGEVLVARRTGQ
jgi:MoxR-like ATPase